MMPLQFYHSGLCQQTYQHLPTCSPAGPTWCISEILHLFLSLIIHGKTQEKFWLLDQTKILILNLLRTSGLFKNQMNNKGSLLSFP